MEFKKNKTPRSFIVGIKKKLKIKDVGTVYLAPNEQLTFVTENKNRYDVARKNWGFYATPSINVRLKKEGFKILSSTFFNPELLLKRGNYTNTKPDFLSKKDMVKGKNIITDLSRRGIGQGIVIRNSHVVTIEDHDGTDAMLKRANILFKRFSYKNKKQGILLKFPKKNQDLRVDLPTIGIKTIRKCAKIGLKGIVVKANQNIFLDRSKCINLANKNKMFICAI